VNTKKAAPAAAADAAAAARRGDPDCSQPAAVFHVLSKIPKELYILYKFINQMSVQTKT
jgi:hypothetical protein